MQVAFVIPGRISGKGRPRFSMRGGIPRTYTDEKTRGTEAMMREIAAKAMGQSPLLEGPLWLTITIWLGIPPSWPKKRHATAIWAGVRPDSDNLLKACCDSWNGVLWRDDSQIAKISFERRYIRDSGPELVEVCVEQLEAQATPLFAKGRAA